MPKYNIQFKRKVLQYFRKHGISKTERKFNLINKTIYRWDQKEKTVGFMRKKTKTYTIEEKMEILNFYFKNGFMETEIKYNISSSILIKWERKFKEYGKEGLAIDNRGRLPKSLSKSNVNNDKDLLEEVQRLRIENIYLKKLDALVQKREEQELKKK